MSGCQNNGPFLGPQNNAAPNMNGNQNGNVILITTVIVPDIAYLPRSVLFIWSVRLETFENVDPTSPEWANGKGVSGSCIRNPHDEFGYVPIHALRYLSSGSHNQEALLDLTIPEGPSTRI